MRFLVDMPVTPHAVEHLRRLGHEATHAAVVGLATVSDAEILEAARREARVVVTADLDYPRLLALEGAEGPAVILRSADATLTVFRGFDGISRDTQAEPTQRKWQMCDDSGHPGT